jgi:hypothetical protein
VDTFTPIRRFEAASRVQRFDASDMEDRN